MGLGWFWGFRAWSVGVRGTLGLGFGVLGFRA